MKRILKALGMAFMYTAIAMLSIAGFLFLVCVTIAGLYSLGIGVVSSYVLSVFIWAFVSIALFEFITDNL